MLIMVSKQGHCLNDLLYRSRVGSLPADIAGIVSNHRDFERLAESYEIPFHYGRQTAAAEMPSCCGSSPNTTLSS